MLRSQAYSSKGQWSTPRFSAAARSRDIDPQPSEATVTLYGCLHVKCLLSDDLVDLVTALEQCEPMVSYQPGLASTFRTPRNHGKALLLGFSITTNACGAASSTFSMSHSVCSNMWSLRFAAELFGDESLCRCGDGP